MRGFGTMMLICLGAGAIVGGCGWAVLDYLAAHVEVEIEWVP